MEFIPLAAAVAFASKLVDTLKYLRGKDWNGVATQLAVWLAGIFAVWLLAASDFGAKVVVAGISLASANFATLALIGVSFVSVGSVAVDFRKARDNQDTAAMPKLTSLSSGPQPPVA